jgi:large subunit ribosomal protein L4
VLDKLFSAKINSKLVSSVLYKTNANYKGRHAKTKQQNEVSGPTSKIYAQKGTGGARHASRKAPIFVGGGIAHGPKGELAYKKRKLNKNEKKLSVASLITEKNKDKNLLILNDFSSEIKKTKEMNSIIQKLEIPNSLIILDKTSKENIEKSVRNIPNVKVTDINHFSSYDIIKFKKVVFTESSVKELEKRYS